ncbi:MAG: sugar phosphate isomerase/epimerase [Lentisphaerae bacterium]|nr:sugar phosphate isomerase/epimerase [Lentisphaerota bacterium]
MADKKVIFSFFCDWKMCPDAMLRSCFAEFRDNGVENLVFVDPWAERIIKDPAFVRMLKLASKDVVNLREMHAPYGECYDLNCVSPARREGLVQDHAKAMAYAAEFGSRTYTIHIGAFDSVFYHTPNEVLRPLALDTLEKLIPYAEKYDIKIAVENSFERSNTPAEVMYYVNYFNHPNVGCCYDSGHAHMMRPGDGKKVYSSYFVNEVWQNDIGFCDNAFEQMASRIVTCHLHDNNGLDDQHMAPGMGNLDWNELANKVLTQAPQLCSIQTEALIFNYGKSITEVIDRYRKVFPGLL